MRQAGARLSLFDAVSLVVGAVIGADVYVVAGLGAPLMGPALLVDWALAGIVAALIALCFAQCAAIQPATGGPYAYVRATLGVVPAMIVGWALYLAEWSALAVFPVAAAGYLVDALGLGAVEVVAFKAVFVAFVTLTNLLGLRAAGTVDDVLTAAKLVPLAALVAAVAAVTAQHPTLIGARLVPIAPLGWGGFGAAFVLVFWAYAGFEVASLPAGAMSHPRTTLPRGIMLGMLIAIAFYLFTSLAVFVAVPWMRIGQTTAPLALAMATTLSALGIPAALGIGLMTAGAVVSIGGVGVATTLGTVELAATLAEHDIVPGILAHRSRRFGTRDVALLVQGGTTLAASLLFGLGVLIDISVFFLVLVYAATAVATWVLLRRQPERRLRVPLMGVIPFLAALASLAVGTGISLRDVGLGAALLGAAMLATLLERLWRHRRW
ncbi:MAG TPA: APC family permease [Chloroflexota bacterium]|nr:APC family permease [Chloroflexota bacterium]